ncbi:DinB family protein [Terribacillus sp. 7520-G]|uniref:DinB family protein n=1 Tax=Terribacillus TaxID=459532 RepID=UPI000BA75B76|nr:DinB family protein [Terribacillus sp. 7520-G]PAD38380.1 squalene--hopene cyclase [Terribacillus sp. 7520-G]
MQEKPSTTEYPAYYQDYMKLVPEGNIAALFKEQKRQTTNLLQGLTDEQACFAYEAGKWTIKEVIGHLTDTERILSYRLLTIARGDVTPLPGFDEDSYVQQAKFTQMTVASLLAQYRAVRASTIALLESLGEQDWVRQGMANGHATSVRALAYIMLGHERHHHEVLHDRYFASAMYPVNRM